MFLKTSPLSRAFQDLSHVINYFSIAQTIVDLVFLTCLRILGNYLDLIKSWNKEFGMEMWKNMEILLSTMF